MYSTSSSVYSVNHQARTLCPQSASTERSRFITGTCSLHEENEIHVLEYREDSNQIDVVAIYEIPDHRSLFHIDSSSKDPSLIVCCDQVKDQSSYRVGIWKLSGQSKEDLDSYDATLGFSGDRSPLENIVECNGCDNTMSQVSWNKKKENNILLSSTTSVSSWTISESEVKITSRLAAEDGMDISIQSNWCNGVSSWDPHNSFTSATAFNNSLHIIDWRRSEITTNIPKAHNSTIRDVDYNPNKPSMLVTGGDDRQVKFWDLRNLSDPIKTLSGHSHWVWCVKYNPFHDQLLISGGSDNVVNLWRIASCSSSPLLDDPDNTNANDEPIDAKVRTMDQHEDSVYSIAWSSADAWVYTSLSYDGRVVLNHVPSTEKYKILL